MKILYLSFIDISQPIGPSVNEREFIPALYNLTEQKAHFIIPKPASEIFDDLPFKHITYIPNSKNKKPLLWLKQQIAAVRSAKKMLKNNEFDFMVIRGGLFAFALLLITAKLNIPFALKTAGSGRFDVFRRKNIFIRMLYPLNQFMFKKLVHRASVVDVVSDIQKKSLEEITGVKDRVYFVDNGVNTERFYPQDKLLARKNVGLEKFDQIFGYVGGSPWERGGLQIIEAIPKLLKTYPNLGGVVVGGGHKMDILFNKAKELGVENNIVFSGVVPFDEVVHYINSFDIGISQLYKDKQGSSEQKVRQYLACGKPVVVSPGAVNNFVEEEQLGHIVSDPYDIEEFTEKVVNMLAMTAEEYEKVSVNARSYAVKHLSVNSRVQQRLDLYKEVIRHVD